MDWRSAFKASENACQQIVDCLRLQQGIVLKYYIRILVYPNVPNIFDIVVMIIVNNFLCVQMEIITHPRSRRLSIGLKR